MTWLPWTVTCINSLTHRENGSMIALLQVQYTCLLTKLYLSPSCIELKGGKE